MPSDIARKRRLDRRYYKRYGRLHPASGPLHQRLTLMQKAALIVVCGFLVWRGGLCPGSPFLTEQTNELPEV